jgi:hypothetical protein
MNIFQEENIGMNESLKVTNQSAKSRGREGSKKKSGGDHSLRESKVFL